MIGDPHGQRRWPRWRCSIERQLFLVRRQKPLVRYPPACDVRGLAHSNVRKRPLADVLLRDVTCNVGCMSRRKHAVRTTIWLGLLALLAWTIWRSSDASLPPLARGVRWSGNGELVFRDRINTVYPIGSSETALLSDLREQGFAVDRRSSGSSQATVSRFFGCGDLNWSVHWTANNGRLTDRRGIWGANCL